MSADRFVDENGWTTWTDSTFSSNTAGNNYGYYQVMNDDYIKIQQEPPKWVDHDSDIHMWIDGDGNITYSHVEEIRNLSKESDFLYEILYKLMNEITLRKLKISDGLKYEVSLILREIEKLDEEDEDGFIQREEMLI